MRKPVRYGPWLLVDRLAVGGMAEVFLAVRDGEPPGRLFALKRLLPQLAQDGELVTLFLDEARLAAQLAHPALLPVRELGRRHGDGYHIAFDYVPGKDLRAVAERARSVGGPLPPGVAAGVARAVADALEHAHRCRGADGVPLHVVHRDVSPGNVLVGYDGVVRLIDFGIAQAAPRRGPVRAAGAPGAGKPEAALRGKFAYMSPEMVRGLPVDRRSDVFALGVVLHELLTGERLFAGRSELSTLERVRNADVPPPSSRRAGIPAALDAVVLRALAREPEDRFAWAADLRDALAPFAAPDTEAKLAAFLARVFADDLRRERERLERLRSEPWVGEVETTDAAPPGKTRG
jgi:serine/threonine-protein kinase